VVRYNLQCLVPNELLLAVWPHLLKFPPPPKILPLAGTKTVNTIHIQTFIPVGDSSYSNHNNFHYKCKFPLQKKEAGGSDKV
jgi:hypothetical protein